jgi:hypothetical protein
MNKQEIKNLLKNVVIEKPCTMSWESMSGDERVRMCSQCNLKVHNLSNMPEHEAAAVLNMRKTERTCVYFLRRKDGTIVVDNCPQKLRNARNKIYAVTASALICLAYGIYISPGHAGGLVGPAVDPAFGQAGEVGMFSDYGYDTARDVARFLTALSSVIVFFIPLDKTKKMSVRRLLLELLALATVPVLIYLAGNFVINNFGGLGGGGI